MRYEQYKKLGNYEPETSTHIAEILSDSIIGLAANEASHALQFPVHTANLNFLALCSIPVSMKYKVEANFGSFKVDMPVCISAITEQEPSSKKTPLFNMITKTIMTATKEANALRAKERAKVDPKKKNGDSELELNDYQIKVLEDNHPIYVTTSDPTIAAINSQVAKTGGWFAEYSTEQDLLNNIVGGKYEKEGSASSMGLLLSAWSGEHSGQARVGRDSFVGVTHGTIITCSQQGALNTFVQNGDSNGLSVRALVIDECGMYGYVKHQKEDRGNRCIQVLQSHIGWLVRSSASMEFDKLKALQITKPQVDTLLALLDELEIEKRKGGSLDSSFARQLYGKLDAHVFRVAAVIHVMSYAGTPDEPLMTISDESFGIALKFVLECFRGMLGIRKSREIGTENQSEQMIIDFLMKQSTKQASESVIKNKVGRNKAFKKPSDCLELCADMFKAGKITRSINGPRNVIYYRMENL